MRLIFRALLLQGEPPVPEDAELSGGRLPGPTAAHQVLLGSSPNSGRRGRGRGQLRPSMEARWRKLDISALQARRACPCHDGTKIGLAEVMAGRGLDLEKLQGRRVLLAEDNLINQKVAQMMLTSLGMVVEVANNGQEAVHSVQKAEDSGHQFHCVLMDMAMPVMGGVEATLVLLSACLLCLCLIQLSF